VTPPVLVRWMLAPPFAAAVVVSLVLIGLAALLSRPDVAFVGLPLAIGAAWAWDRRPPRTSAPHLTGRLDRLPEDGTLGYRLSLEHADGIESVRLRVTAPHGRSHEVVLDGRALTGVRGSVPVSHTGVQDLVRAEIVAVASDGAFAFEPAQHLVLEGIIAPTVRPIAALPLPRHLPGLTGNHDSTRAGEGGDFRDIGLFAPGDRLKRIDWKATVRRAQNTGELYARRSSATADATVILVIDSRDDIGSRVDAWGLAGSNTEGRTSMDVAREAASSLAAAYIKAGDRVGLRDLATQRRSVSDGAGTRHLERLQRAVALARPSGMPQRRERAPLVAVGSLIYVLSTFLDDEASRMANIWRAAGHRVIAVDVLPAPVTAGASRELALALRLVLAERDERIHELRARGVELLRWEDEGERTVESQLRALSRPSRRSA